MRRCWRPARAAGRPGCCSATSAATRRRRCCSGPLRGSGPAGLAAMAPLRPAPGGAGAAAAARTCRRRGWRRWSPRPGWSRCATRATATRASPGPGCGRPWAIPPGPAPRTAALAEAAGGLRPAPGAGWRRRWPTRLAACARLLPGGLCRGRTRRRWARMPWRMRRWRRCCARSAGPRFPPPPGRGGGAAAARGRHPGRRLAAPRAAGGWRCCGSRRRWRPPVPAVPGAVWDGRFRLLGRARRGSELARRAPGLPAGALRRRLAAGAAAPGADLPAVRCSRRWRRSAAMVCWWPCRGLDYPERALQGLRAVPRPGSCPAAIPQTAGTAHWGIHHWGWRPYLGDAGHERRA